MQATIDKHLATTLSQAKIAPIHFAFIEKASEEGKLLLAVKSAVPSKEVNEARAKLGGGVVFAGRCSWDAEHQHYLFEIGKDPSATLAKSIKAIIHRDAGLTANVVVRKAPDLAAEHTGAPAPAVPPPATPAPDSAAVAFTERLKALLPDIKRAHDVTSGDTAALHELFAEVQALAKDHNFAGAGAVLDAVEALVHQVLIDAGHAPEYEKLLARLAPEVEYCLKEQLGDTSKIRALHSFAQGKAETGHYGAALQSLKTLEGVLSAARAGAAPKLDADLSPVKISHARFGWKQARLKAVQGLQRVREDVYTLFQDDIEQQTELTAAMERLDGLVAQLGDDLDDQLDALFNEIDPVGRAQRLATARATMTSFANLVDTDPIMAALDDNEIVPGTRITGLLKEQLAQIAAVLG